jgi:hypothetical protein
VPQRLISSQPSGLRRTRGKGLSALGLQRDPVDQTQTTPIDVAAGQSANPAACHHVLRRSPTTSRRPAGFVEPCLPTLAHTMPGGPLYGRSPVTSATIDGEAVVCGADGVSDFDRLRLALARRGSVNAFRYAFDLLELGTAATCTEPYGRTAARPWCGCWARPATASGCPSTWRATGRPCSATPAPRGSEGIVSKRQDRPYRSGRSPDWINVKNPDAPAATRAME